MATDPNLLLALVNAPTLGGQSIFQGIDQGLQRQQAQQALAANAFQLQQAQQQAQQQQQYQVDVSGFTRDPSPQSLMNLIAKYPKQYEALQAGWRLKDQAQRTSDLGFYSDIHGALSKGNTKLAISSIEQRLAAEKRAGIDTSEEEAWLEQLKGGDPNAVRSVQALALGQIAAATGPDKFSEAYKTVGGDAGGFTLGPGSRRFDENGKLIAQAPFAPRPVTVGEGQTVVEYDPNGGSSAASGSNPLPRMLEITPFSESGNREFNADGTRVTSPKGARGVMQVMPKTATNPGYGIEPSNGTPEDDARLGKQYLGKMLEIYGNPAQAWAAYNAGPAAVDKAIREGGDRWLQKLPAETRQYVAKNMSALNGGGQSGSRVIAQGAPKPGYRPATPAEKAAYGIGADTPAQISPDGKVDVISGTKGGAAVDPKAEGLLRKEFNTLPEVKDFKEVRAAYQQVQGLATKKSPSAADDIALLFSYMKMLDPSSVVRETEFATAQNATGVPDQIRNAYNRALSGNRVNPQQRKEIIGAAATAYQTRRKTYNATADRYRGIAEDYGYNAGRIAPLALTPDELRARQREMATPAPTAQQRPQFRIVARRPAR